MSTKFDGGVHEVDAEGVVDEAKVVGQGSAVAGEIESVDGVGDQCVEGLCGGDKGVDVVGEGGEVGVEVVVGGEQCVELILDVLIEIDSRISIVDKGSGVFHYLLVALN